MKNNPDYIPQGTKEEIKEQLKSWIGKKVKRGPTWDWDNQDKDCYGNQTEGTIVEIGNYFSCYCYGVRVKWENSHLNSYRVGNEFVDVILIEENNIKSSNDPVCCGQKMDRVNMAYKCSKCWRVI